MFDQSGEDELVVSMADVVRATGQMAMADPPKPPEPGKLYTTAATMLRLAECAKCVSATPTDAARAAAHAVAADIERLNELKARYDFIRAEIRFARQTVERKLERDPFDTQSLDWEIPEVRLMASLAKLALAETDMGGGAEQFRAIARWEQVARDALNDASSGAA